MLIWSRACTSPIFADASEVKQNNIIISIDWTLGI